MSDIELRPFLDGVEVRSVQDDAGKRLVLSGTAIRYGARSKVIPSGGFRERVMPGAGTEVLQKAEVEAREEHLPNRYLGRTGNGSLRLFDTKESLRYEVDLLDDQVGREVAMKAERGDYKGSSFGFRAAAATWTKDDDGTPLRTITAFKLIQDVGPTVRPAYDTGTAEAALRCLPDELGRAIEFRSVLESSDPSARLAELIEADAEERSTEETTETGLVIHRRSPHLFL